MVLPGEVVALPEGAALGRGLYRSPEDGLVRASLFGTLSVEDGVARIAHAGRAAAPPVPELGQTVVGRVSRLSSKYAAVDVLFIDGAPPVWLGEPFRATLRATDIWPAAVRDAPPLIAHAVRPGDLVRARIIGVGDASAGFFLACGGGLLLPPAEFAALGQARPAQAQAADVDALGVVCALSQTSGAPMVPAAWNEMACPLTGARESRRPARPVGAAVLHE